MHTTRWARLTILAIGCSSGWGGPARGSAKPTATEPTTAVTFTSQQGTAPPGQLVSIEMGEGALLPVLRVAYTGVGGWLSAGVTGSGLRRELSVQPVSHTLGPGVYRANIDLGRSGAIAPTHVQVTLVVRGRSGASCPPNSTLRYTGGGDGRSEPTDFGRTFFSAYCTACHASKVAGASRSGAPPDLNWDTIAAIRAQRNWIDAVAALGPGSSRDDAMPQELVMPPAFVPIRPMQAERVLLAQWIACGAP